MGRVNPFTTCQPAKKIKEIKPSAHPLGFEPQPIPPLSLLLIHLGVDHFVIMCYNI
ncbi:unnamed protein product [Prunus brigantina]